MKYIIAVVLLLTLAITAQAQDSDLTESYVFENSSLRIYFSDKWEAVEEEDTIYFVSADTTYVPYWYFPADYADLELQSGDSENALRIDLADLEDHEFDADNIETITVADVELTVYRYEAKDDNGSYEAARIAREFAWGGYVVASVYPTSEENLNEQDFEEAVQMTFYIEDTLLAEGIGYAGGGIQFEIPEDWQYFVDDFDTVHIQNEATNATFYYLLPEDFDEVDLEPGDVPASVPQLLDFIYGEDAEFDESNLSTDGDFTLYTYEAVVDDETVTGILVSLELEDGTIFSADVFANDPAESVNEDDYETVLKVLETSQRIETEN